MFYGPTIFFAKLALFLLYFRIFSCDRWTKIGIYLGIVSNLLFYAAAVTVFGVLGIRRSGESWLSNAETARYRKAYLMAYIQGSFGVVSDIYIFILPLPVLWRLNMTPRKKLVVSSVFLAGFMYVHFPSLSDERGPNPFSDHFILISERAHQHSRAILASVLGLYYRVITVTNPDLTWRLPPTVGLA